MLKFNRLSMLGCLFACSTSLAATVSPLTHADSEPQNNGNITDVEGSWDDDWGDDSAVSNWQFSGFTELGLGYFTQHNALERTNSLEEIRNRLEVSYRTLAIDLVASTDAVLDGVVDDAFWQTRELYAAKAFKTLNIKVGRQISTWGTGDYLFLNDLFPKDWSSFFAGRDDEYLKAPSDSLRLSTYLDTFNIDLVYSPDFTADQYIKGERFSFFSPNDAFGQPNPVSTSFLPVKQTSHSQWSARLSTTLNGIEYALYGYHGAWTTPVGVNMSDHAMPYAYFPALSAYGGSVRLPLGVGLFNAEFSVYNSLDDSAGNNPNVPNDQTKVLIGYEQELIKNLTGSVQYYVEHMHEYSKYRAHEHFPEFSTKQNRDLITVRLTHLAFKQKLTSAAFLFYSPSDNDGYLKASVNYRYSDNMSYAAGVNAFFGEENFTFFGQHQENSNIWLRARFNY